VTPVVSPTRQTSAPDPGIVDDVTAKPTSPPPAPYGAAIPALVDMSLADVTVIDGADDHRFSSGTVGNHRVNSNQLPWYTFIGTLAWSAERTPP
jgi:hypothetical protein